MTARFATAFEAGLQKIVDGLQKPRAEKRYDKLLERIGRLKEKSRGASQHYTINLTKGDDGEFATALSWEKSAVPGTMATHPGVYCLRSNELNWDEEVGQAGILPSGQKLAKALAYLYHADGSGKRIPQPEERTGFASRVSLEGRPLGWSSVYHGTGVSVRTNHSCATEKGRDP